MLGQRSCSALARLIERMYSPIPEGEETGINNIQFGSMKAKDLKQRNGDHVPHFT
jgi:hypothetical protein